MNINCVNPNYIVVSKTKLRDSHLSFVSREAFLAHVPNPHTSVYKTRCGKCLACKLYKSYQWSNRLMAEASDWNYCYFITFTFNDNNYDIEALSKKPMREYQLFMKRLRKKHPMLKFKYYATSELGGETLRFHYHAILYSQIDIFYDRRYYKEKLWSSKELTNVWQNGGAYFAFATHDTMRYVANYVQDTKESIQHSFSRDLGYKLMKDSKDGFYVVNGSYAPVTRTIREQQGITLNLKEFIDLENIGIKTHDEEARQNAMRGRLIKSSFFRKKL